MLSVFFIYRPKFALVISLVITIAGMLGYLALPVEQFPNITPPVVNVSASYSGANATVLEETVAAPIEAQVNGEIEATRVNADWHGWLHHSWDETPEARPLAHKTWEKPHQENLTGTALAYAPAGSIRREKPADRGDYEAWQPE